MIRRWHNAQIGVLAAIVFLIAEWPPLAVQAQQGPTNLLVNGGFEYWDWNVRSWPLQDGIAEVQVCPGWRAYYVDAPPAKAKAPDYWRRPEFRDVKASEFPDRVRSGFLAAKYFSFAGQHEAGFYQQVGGTAPGTPLRFSVYMQTWSCMASTEWNVCPTGEKSNNPSRMHTRIGIDPYGDTNPWSPNVVWSPEVDAYDIWTYFQVEATARNSVVTVFTYSWADWSEEIFRMHNDVYLDDASLIALNEVFPTPTSVLVAVAPTATSAVVLPSRTSGPTPTLGPTSTLAPTPTPRPDNASVYVVQPGDTLGAIAAWNKVTLEQLRQLNGLENPNMLQVGQELVISIPTLTVTSTPALTFTSIPHSPTPTAIPPSPTLEPPSPTTAPPTATRDAPTPAPTTMPTATIPVDSGDDVRTIPWVGIVSAALVVAIVVVFGLRQMRR